LGFDWRLGLCLKFTRYRGGGRGGGGGRGEGRGGGGGGKSSTTFTFSILFVLPMLLPIYVAFLRSAFPASGFSSVRVAYALM